MRHRGDTICNLSAYVCDCFLGTHEFCAFNFILKIGCDMWTGRGPKSESGCWASILLGPAPAVRDEVGMGFGPPLLGFFVGLFGLC